MYKGTVVDRLPDQARLNLMYKFLFLNATSACELAHVLRNGAMC